MIKTLIVEDDATQLESYSDVIESFNRTAVDKIDPEIARNLVEAQTLLAAKNYDAAIIDLILEGGARGPLGNQVIKVILEKLRFPVFVYSGNLGQLDPSFTENIFFKKFARDVVSFKTLLEEASKVYRTGITRILGRTGLIEAQLHDIFWTHLSQSLDYWFVEGNERTLLRYVLAHIQEYLDLNPNGEFDSYVPAEVYIVPPIKKFPFTGLILKKKGGTEHYVVVSPPCDLAQAKTKSIAIAAVEELLMGLVKEKKTVLAREFKNGMTKDEYGKLYDLHAEAKETLRRLVSNSHAAKYHYLPPSKHFLGGFINFQRISTCSPEGLAQEFDPIAAVTSEFCKDIIARFSYYYSRQGQPDMDRDKLLVELLKA